MLRRVLVLVLLLSLLFPLSCSLRRPRLEEACFPLSDLSREVSRRYKGVQVMRGLYSLKLKRDREGGLLRGEFYFDVSRGLRARFYSPFASRIAEARVKGSEAELYFLQEGVLYQGGLQGEEILCLRFVYGEVEGRRLPVRLIGSAMFMMFQFGRIGPWDFELRLKALDLDPSPSAALPPMRVPPGVIILPLRDLLEVLGLRA